MNGLPSFILEQSREGLLSWKAEQIAVNRYGSTVRNVEQIALEQGIMPARYQRNSQTISVEQQLCLHNSKTAIIGCGGLGGYIIEELARLGVGEIVAVDPDVFEEHNINRQLYSSPENLGFAKVEAAATRVHLINPAVNIIPVKERFSEESGQVMLAGIHVAVDGLDSVSTRLSLSRVCRKLTIPLVHGAICGWFGQVTTQFPGETTIEQLYGSCLADKGMEKKEGNPAFTPAVVASLQVAEVCKILLGLGCTLRRRMLYINLLDMELEEIPL